MKPEIGYGSRGVKLIQNFKQGQEHLNSYPTCLILENLPGKEFTVDCFTDKNRKLLFSAGRERKRISNGISVNTVPVEMEDESLKTIARHINAVFHFRGAWFFQVKYNDNGALCLLEVASRLGGSSSLFRNMGVNFALLSIFDAFGYDVNVFSNSYNIELDRSLNNKYKLDITFDKAYIDFDDCLILGDKVNTALLGLLYQFLNQGKKLVLITKHKDDIYESLIKFRLDKVFDEIIHLEQDHFKFEYIDKEKAIFIDDSYAERYQVHKALKIPVFAPDSIECLID
ncbi:ATP-grasp domain-containing protein [Cyclobacterium qasimii]|uniref:ATP-grasp enzyme-like protein n=1 Tax=Cyclobacterium qasimii M12-11B TaxID=641524 RepID=S7WHW5_9BACT|nr:ATP-grasp domain-containing protein [Cyclobacterium qasimii]EPR66324.1 ATP-grasp enzyme-like protein [Cyclobacterium qasimii M12-11B]